MLKFFKDTNKYYSSLVIYFILFGFIVAVIASLINYSILLGETRSSLKQSSVQRYEILSHRLESFMKTSENTLESILRDRDFNSYLLQKTPKKREHAGDVFFALALSNKDFGQIRYLNEYGEEEIRINQEPGYEPSLVHTESLQNKSKRYYFIEVSKLRPGYFWHSKIDLNVENEKLEIPYQPVIRVGTPVYSENRFKGILIINIYMKDFFHEFSKLNNFDTFIVDKEGEFLLHHDPEYSWSRYLKKEKKINDEFPKEYTNILNQKNYAGKYLYSFSLENLIQNHEGLKLVLRIEPEVLDNIKKSNIKSALYLLLLILVLSAPVSSVLALVPSNLHLKMNNLVKELKKYTDIIDQNVITTSTDKAGIITKASKAFCDISGYSINELIGKKHNVLRGDTPIEIYNDLWATITKGEIWRGEFHNKRKDGTYFWVEQIITPEENEDGEIIGYSEISYDITDKKEIQRISETDGLTGIYNRMKTESLLKYELERSRRFSSELGIVLIDIDWFKRINDTYGHMTGDKVLQECANLLKFSLRKSDTIGRWGGEEFLVICPETPMDHLLQVAEKLKEEISNYDFSPAGKMTISQGVANLHSGDNIETLVTRADQALYVSKNSGRNSVHAG